MAQLPVPRSGPRPLAVRVPGAIDYEPADSVGFDRMPQAVVSALAGVLAGVALAANADDPVARRQKDGITYQQAKGWWAGANRYLTIDARRLLAPAEGNSLKPASGWKIDGTVSYFAPGVEPISSRWRFTGANRTGADRNRKPADDPLDVLPEQLAAPVRGATPGAWLHSDRGRAEETIVAALATEGRIRVLKCQRQASSEQALPLADWYAMTIDAPITAVRLLRTDASGRVLIGPSASPTGEAVSDAHMKAKSP